MVVSVVRRVCVGAWVEGVVRVRRRARRPVSQVSRATVMGAASAHPIDSDIDARRGV